MSKKNVTLLADKSYVPPDPPEPVTDLSEVEKTKLKSRISSILKNGPGVLDPSGTDLPAGPMETWKVIHYACHQGRLIDGIANLKASHVVSVIGEMRAEGAFADGYDGTRKPEEVASPQ